jgi:PAN domain
MSSQRGRIDGKATTLMLPWCGVVLALVAVSTAVAPAHAQKGFDRPGGDYTRFVVPSGDPAVCAARCDREGRCRAWTFSYPGTVAIGGSNSAICWLKSEVKPAVENPCCVSGVKGAGLIETRPGPVEASIDRTGGDYRSFDLPSDPTAEPCKKACEGESRCRAWTYVRPGYLGPSASARCYLKSQVKPPRRKPCCMSGVVR